MSNKKLLRITELSAAFKNAVEASPVSRDPQIQQKVLKSLKPGEMEEMQDLLQEIVNESLAYAFGGEPSDEFLKKNIKLCEITADLFLRVSSAETVASYVPAELKNKADSKALRKLGANKLADLCEFKAK